MCFFISSQELYFDLNTIHTKFTLISKLFLFSSNSTGWDGDNTNWNVDQFDIWDVDNNKSPVTSTACLIAPSPQSIDPVNLPLQEGDLIDVAGELDDADFEQSFLGWPHDRYIFSCLS